MDFFNNTLAPNVRKNSTQENNPYDVRNMGERKSPFHSQNVMDDLKGLRSQARIFSQRKRNLGSPARIY